MENNQRFTQNFPKQIPPQHQNIHPGIEKDMNPKPIYDNPNYKGSRKLQNKVALITGGDSGIGRAVSISYAKEGADISIVYFNEHEDAKETKEAVMKYGRRCILISGDIKDSSFCKSAVTQTVTELGGLDILINNAAVQYVQNTIENITDAQLEETFKTNIFSMFYLTREALSHMKRGASIINTTSVTAYNGNELLIDYSSTKGAIVSFTRSMAISLASRGIRVNAVAPGPVWTPLIPSSFNTNKVKQFGANTSFGRPGQPVELAPAYVFLGSEDSSFITGEVIHVNGGEIVNG